MSSNDLDSMSMDELVARFSELMGQNELLAKQNRLFDSYLHRHPLVDDDIKRHIAHANRSRRRQVDELNLYQKYDTAVHEQEYRQSQLKSLESKAGDDIGLLKAITEGIRIRINEMRKETYEFKRDIVIGGENTRTGAIMAEKVIRYYEDKLKQKNALIEKLKLKNNSLKVFRQKMDVQVKYKEEQGDSLHSIDFHQLQIKNSQFNKKIQERNNELLQLKMTTGKTVQVLNTAKRRLGELSLEAEKLKVTIEEREKSIVRLERELGKVNQDVGKEKDKNKKFKIQQSNPDMPQVLDYVNQKSKMYHLDGQVRNWQRKCEIVSMAAKRARTTLRKLDNMGLVFDPSTGELVQVDPVTKQPLSQTVNMQDTTPMHP